MRLRPARALALAAATLFILTAVWQTNKPLPPGTHVASPVCTVGASEVALLTDVTAADAYGRPVSTQEIFPETLRLVRAARRFVVLDYELIGADSQGTPQRHLAAELGDALIAQRRAQPQLRVLLITDPVNARYGHAPSAELGRLRAAGIEVVRARLERLRDPNFLYSALWKWGW